MSSRRIFLTFTALAAGMMASGMSLAAADLGDALHRTLATAAPGDQLEVIVSFKQAGPLRATQVQALKAIGIGQGVSMQALPMAGILATPGQIAQIAAREDVQSIRINRDLSYANDVSRRNSGVDTLQANPSLGYTGRGVAIMINDSGIDATHGDLTYGSKVVQNVQALTNLRSLVDFLPVTVLEGQLNTDISSGHGTHCAGTAGGTGARSANNRQYRGVATDAKIVGYGSGAVISILDAIGGFDYALAHRNSFGAAIKVISNSWGTSGKFDPNDPVNLASYAAYKQGIVSVFAAGNDGPDANTHNPYAQAPWVISVAAANQDGTLADFSSRGNPGEGGGFDMPDGSHWSYVNQPSLAATGVDVVSTRALTGALPVLGASKDAALGADLPYYTTMSGTSMATPHVAGIVALLYQAKPSLTPLEIKQILQATANPMAGRAAFEVGSGHVDALEAAQVAKTY